MKKICALMMAGFTCVGLTYGQSYYETVVLGPSPIVLPVTVVPAATQQPAAQQIVQQVVVQTPVYVPVPVAAPAPVYTDYGYYGYNGYSGYNNNVIYVGGPGSCGPYYDHAPYYSTPNVIYFGHGQAHRQGYNFRHCR